LQTEPREPLAAIVAVSGEPFNSRARPFGRPVTWRVRARESLPSGCRSRAAWIVLVKAEARSLKHRSYKKRAVSKKDQCCDDDEDRNMRGARNDEGVRLR